ncbi:MAG: hypothetical protein ACYS6W_04035 [Planctomycetota bacterium]|jgi:hypothetical protein
MRIALVPNDDGFGPSALAFYVAKALLKPEVSLVVRNEIRKGTVSLQPMFTGIPLQKAGIIS